MQVVRIVVSTLVFRTFEGRPTERPVATTKDRQLKMGHMSVLLRLLVDHLREVIPSADLPRSLPLDLQADCHEPPI